MDISKHPYCKAEAHNKAGAVFPLSFLSSHPTHGTLSPGGKGMDGPMVWY